MATQDKGRENFERMRKCLKKNGLSLVETIAVVGLISLVILLTLGLVPSFKISNRRANMELLAGNLAQSTLEQQRAQPFSAAVSVPSTAVALDGIDYNLEVIVSPGSSANTKRVRALVSWQWKEKSLRTFRESIICRVPRS